MDELHDYEFYFGVSEPDHDPPIRPWHLRHVTEFSTRVDTTTVEMGIPGRPPSDIQVFQTQGVIREFTITGIRMDSEEYVSNLQFMRGKYSIPYPHDDMTGVKKESVSVGLSSMMSVIQSAVKKYKLIIKRRDVGTVSAINDSLPVGVYDVALTGMTVEEMQQRGTVKYKLTMQVGLQTGVKPFTQLVRFDSDGQ